jgi:hypothetical protein
VSFNHVRYRHRDSPCHCCSLGHYLHQTQGSEGCEVYGPATIVYLSHCRCLEPSLRGVSAHNLSWQQSVIHLINPISITSHPRQKFMVILNPNSGPGNLPYPNTDYSSQIQKLNSFPNVRTVGYVRTDFAKRNITSVLLDVAIYSGWATNPNDGTNLTALALHGIFFDEVPNEYSPETATYLSTINLAVKNASGLLPGRTVSLIHFSGHRWTI